MARKATASSAKAAPSAKPTKKGDPNGSIGLVVLDVTNPFFTEVARGAEDAANDSNYSVMLCNSDGSESKEARYLEALTSQGAQGVVITPARQRLGYLGLLRKRGVGVVLLDRHGDGEDFCSVSVDNVRGGTYVGRHLTEGGRRRIVFVSGPRTVEQAAERRDGLCQAVADAGLDPNAAVADVTVRAFSAHEGYTAVDRVLAAKPDAVFCANDLLALGVLRGLVERGVSVPDDVALVGYDDVEFASILQTPLTTVRQPKYGLGSAAARLLVDELAQNGDHSHQQRVFTPELVVRASTGG